MAKNSYLKYILILLFFILFILFAIPKKEEIKEIKFGASLPLGGINQNLGEEVVVGVKAYFNHINAKGGIKGKKIKFIYYDDKYEPEITITNTNKLLKEDRVFSLFSFVGTPTVKKILPLVEDTDIPFIAPYTGAKFLRDTHLKNIVNFRSSYEDEIDTIVEYLVKKRGFSRFSIFYQNDDYGKEGYIALIKALKKRGLSLNSEGTYKRNTLFIKQAIYDIKSKKPQAIILVGAYKPTARFIKKAKECCFDDVIFTPISFVNSDVLMEELNHDGKNIIFSQTVPSYEDNSKIANEYKKILKFYYPEKSPTFASYEAFLSAKCVAKALKKSDKIDKENFLNQIKHLKPSDLGGLEIGYKNSQLLNQTYLFKYEKNRFKMIYKREK